MTTKPRAKKFRIRRTPRGDVDSAGDTLSNSADDTPQDGFGAERFPTAGPDNVLGDPEAEAEAARAAIRAEGLSARQLRLARRVAQRHGLQPRSDLDAVRLLRMRGIDPFKRSSMLDLVVSDAQRSQAVASGTAAPATASQLPQTYRPNATPSTDFAPAPSPESEVMEIQRDIAKRRRRRLMLLAARLVVFVLLPTLIAGYYYTRIATPLYATHAEFVIQQADMQGAGGAGNGLSGLFSGTGLATSQDSITVQSYLESREAMRRLDAEHGFKAHFSQDWIDPVRRLDTDASDEAAYRLYQRNVNIGYDPTEGIIRMEVIAADPDTSEAFSRALVSYAEEQVDQLTSRLRGDQMEGARRNFEEAEQSVREARQRVVDLQERFEVMSSDIEVELLTSQIATLQGELTQARLSLQELLTNERPNPARVQPLERRIESLRNEISDLRAQLTEGSETGESLARIRSQLVMAEAEVETRQMMLSQAMQQLEAARVEADRQVRYLSMGVNPVAPDEPSYPRAVENTALALLIFAGIYLMLSMTASILREQVSA